MHLDGLDFYPKYGLNAGVLLSRLDRLRRSNFTAVRERIIGEWGPGGRGLLYLGDQVSCCGRHSSLSRQLVPHCTSSSRRGGHAVARRGGLGGARLRLLGLCYPSGHAMPKS